MTNKNRKLKPIGLFLLKTAIVCVSFAVRRIPFSLLGLNTLTLKQTFYVSFFKPNHAKNLGVPGYQSSLLVGYLSVASTVSRVLFGLILNHPRVNRFYVLQVLLAHLSFILIFSSTLSINLDGIQGIGSSP